MDGYIDMHSESVGEYVGKYASRYADRQNSMKKSRTSIQILENEYRILSNGDMTTFICLQQSDYQSSSTLHNIAWSGFYTFMISY